MAEPGSREVKDLLEDLEFIVASKKAVSIDLEPWQASYLARLLKADILEHRAFIHELNET